MSLGSQTGIGATAAVPSILAFTEVASGQPTSGTQVPDSLAYTGIELTGSILLGLAFVLVGTALILFSRKVEPIPDRA